jgi:hypothetical protein
MDIAKKRPKGTVTIRAEWSWKSDEFPFNRAGSCKTKVGALVSSDGKHYGGSTKIQIGPYSPNTRTSSSDSIGGRLRPVRLEGDLVAFL